MRRQPRRQRVDEGGTEENRLEQFPADVQRNFRQRRIRILWSMSGLILFIVAVALLGVAIYSLVSYLKERRASQLPVHKKKK